MMKIREIKSKKDSKLVVQLGVIIGVIFTLIAGFTVFVTVTGSKRAYFEAKEEALGAVLIRTKEALYNSLSDPGWFFNYWRDHAEEINQERDYFTVAGQLTEWGLYENDVVGASAEQMDALSKDQQAALAWFAYNVFYTEVNSEQWKLSQEFLLVIDIRQGYEGFVYAHGAHLGNGSVYVPTLGLYWDDHLEDEHPAIDRIRRSKNVSDIKNIRYERFDFPKQHGYFYIGFLPVWSNGEVVALIGVIHNWSDFHSKLMTNLLVLSLIIAAGLILAAAALLIFVRRAVVNPLQRVQKTLRSYMQDKDRRQVVDQMAAIMQTNEFGVLADDVAELATEIERYTEENAALTGERERVATELGLATKIQAAMLPEIPPECPEFHIYASMTPAKEVGGDFYDFFKIDEDHLGLVIADVTGKGVPAALFMMISKILLKEFALQGLSPAEAMRNMNLRICEKNPNAMFVTVWFGILEISTGRVKAVNAGHEYPILKPVGGSFEVMKDKHGGVVGASDLMPFREYEFRMDAGATLFVYTDGAPEATNSSEEMFGMDRVVECLNRDPEAEPVELTERLHEEIDRFTGDAPQFDDLTMLCVKYLKEG